MAVSAKPRAKLNPVFNSRAKKPEPPEIAPSLVKEARKSGELNLSSHGLAHIPKKVWHIEALDDDELKLIDVSFDAECDVKWWEPVPLTLLNLSGNSIKSVPSDIRFLDALTTLHLDANSLEKLPNELGRLSKLEKLTLSRNKLKSLPDGLFDLRELTHLDLSQNAFELLPDGIGNLVMLKNLNVSANQLKDLNPGIGFLTRLQELNASCNKLVDIAPDLCTIRALTRLDVSVNEISTIPPLGELRKLEALNLAHNALTELPDVLGCSALREVYLAHNKIETLDEDRFPAMAHIKVLDLESNFIEVIPDSVTLLQHLVRLNLIRNKIKILPPNVGLLPHLSNLQVTENPIENVRRDIIACGTRRVVKFLRQQTDGGALLGSPCEDEPTDRNFPDRWTLKSSKSLNLANQGLTSIPDSVFVEAKVAEVLYVDLAKNKLQSIPQGICELEELASELNVSCNMLTTVPPKLSCLYKLQFIDLQRNKLQSLPQELATLLRLREINISYNKFTAVPECIYDMVGLELLFVSDNQVKSIEVAKLKRLTRLATLDLRNNDIAVVPPELGTCDTLRKLELGGNSFRTPNHSCLEKGTEFLLCYLRDRIIK